MHTLDLVLYVLGAFCFLLEARRLVSSEKVSLVALGLLFWILVPLIALVHSG